MTKDLATNGPDGNDSSKTGISDSSQPHFESTWEKPYIPSTGGEATLLVRVTPSSNSNDVDHRAPLDIAFVLDRSGSMGGEKLPLAKEGIDLGVARLRDQDRAALVVYDDQVQTVQSLAAATPRMKAALRLSLHGIDPGGSTFLSGGWITGCQELAEAPVVASEDSDATRIRRVILLTDGLANVGILDPRELAQHAGELRRRAIATTTVGVGEDFDEGLLSAMAEAGGGNFQYVADPEQLRAFFGSELQELFTVATTGLTITLTLPESVTAELISVFPVETQPGKQQVAIGDLPAGDVIELVFTIRAGAGAAGEQLRVGINAAWTDTRADNRLELDISPPKLRRAKPEVIANAEPDLLVTERAALQRAAAERRAGLELDRAGQFAGSRLRMQKARDILAHAPATPSVQEDYAEAFSLAEAPTTAAYSSHQRKDSQYREQLRRRGRLGSSGKDPNSGL